MKSRARDWRDITRAFWSRLPHRAGTVPGFPSCGADVWEDIWLFAKIRFLLLKKFIKLRNSVTSHDIISRVVRMVRREAFQEAFLAWVSGTEKTRGPSPSFFRRSRLIGITQTLNFLGLVSLIHLMGPIGPIGLCLRKLREG